MKKLLIVLLVLNLCPSAYSIAQQTEQIIRFSYDNTGNRILRMLHIEEIKTGDATNQELVQSLPERFSNSKEAVNDIIKVYPNPTQRIVNIEKSVNAKTAFTGYVYDINAKLIEIIEFEDYILEYNMERFEPGTYFLILTDKEHSFHYKIIKQ
ncbi:MAG: T9SS type A sorting domain-containing protein [Bacteroidetes bacterium]|nr:T9SS type A sorting domain-containing protein [Bacteroidota bacterium]